MKKRYEAEQDELISLMRLDAEQNGDHTMVTVCDQAMQTGNIPLREHARHVCALRMAASDRSGRPWSSNPAIAESHWPSQKRRD